MASDLRHRHDESLRLQAARLHDAGLGRRAIGARLGVPHEAVRRWLENYGAGGTELLLKMDGKQARYDCETKVAAASAVVDGGMSKPEAMARFGIASGSPPKSWCRLYREGGAEALRPRPKGRPRGSGPKAAPRTREQELEERVRRLEAQVAYLKKSIAPKAERRSRAGRGPWRSPSFQGRATASPTCWRPPGWPGRRTATRSRTRRRRPGRSCAPGSRRSSAGSPTASATGRWRWGCAPSTAPAWRTRRCSR